MFIFVDESGQTNIQAKQKYLVISFCVCKNKKFPDELIRSIYQKCAKEAKPILNKKEIKYHDISRFQQEIAIGIINKTYKNFYVAYVDIEKTDRALSDGKSEEIIQKSILQSIAVIFQEKIEKQNKIKIFVDKKLSKDSLKEIRILVQMLKKSKKDVSVKEKNSQSLCGLQLADLIAGSFRAKLMKISNLLEIKDENIFSCEATKNGLITRRNK